MKLPPVYPIVNVAGASPMETDRAYLMALELAEAGCPLLQLRAKELGAGAMTELAVRIVEALASYRTELILNDRADVAAVSGAQGVHLGHQDLPVEAARRVFEGTGCATIVGYSTHSAAEAAAASHLGADYLGFGPVFDSPTKAGVREARGLTMLAAACRATDLPVVAIGGVTLENAAACWKAGASSVAVLSDIEGSRDRAALVAAYIEAARKNRP